MPEIADVSYEYIIVCEVDIHVVVKCDELIAGNFVVNDSEERKKVGFNLL